MKVKVISLPYIFQVLYVLCFTRPRYQVSVYRTNGPLFFCSFFFFGGGGGVIDEPEFLSDNHKLTKRDFPMQRHSNSGRITVLLLAYFILRPYLVDVSLMSVSIYEKDIVYLRKIPNIYRVSIRFISVQRL